MTDAGTPDSRIDDGGGDVLRERRTQAVRRLVSLEVEDPPDAATLSRELETAHESCGVPFDSGVVK